MKEESQNSISAKVLERTSVQDASTSTSNPYAHHGQSFPPCSTYESFFLVLNYIKMFITRLGKDLLQTVLYRFYSNKVLPKHIVELMRAHKRLHLERGMQTGILNSEDEVNLHETVNKDGSEFNYIDKEPMYIIVDSSCISEPSSEMLLDLQTATTKDHLLKRHFNAIVLADMPSTSKNYNTHAYKLQESESQDELLMKNINLQSENAIEIDENENESESIVISYLKNKDALKDLEGTMLLSKKKASLLESVPKMETIVEGQQFSAFPITPDELSPNRTDSDREEITKTNSEN